MVMTDRRKKPDKERPKRNEGDESSLKRLEFILYKKQVPRKTIYREALISLRSYKCQDKLRDMKKYTMKSLILAQDER